MANMPEDIDTQYTIWPTTAVASRIWRDVNGDRALTLASDYESDDAADERFNESIATVRFARYSNTLYTPWDLSCEGRQRDANETTTPCLNKGDLLMLADLTWFNGPQESNLGTTLPTSPTMDLLVDHGYSSYSMTVVCLARRGRTAGGS